MLQVGDNAPDFALSDQDGNVHRLSDQRGSWVVVYFYPKDDTPGCTTEACQFRDALPRFGDIGAKVYGISADDRASHEAFAAKFDLNFPLLTDPGMATINAYGAYGEKEVGGEKRMGILRQSYLVDPQGRIAHVWATVDPDGHADEVGHVMERLRAETA
ncbi:MAG: peroxiredoxin [Trueperaceae bacterium]|nr:peroxiredoxin [Trueperaceae bacterium]